MIDEYVELKNKLLNTLSTTEAIHVAIASSNKMETNSSYGSMCIARQLEKKMEKNTKLNLRVFK